MSSSDERPNKDAKTDGQNEPAVSRRSFLKGTRVVLTIPLVASGEKVVGAVLALTCRFSARRMSTSR